VPPAKDRAKPYKAEAPPPFTTRRSSQFSDAMGNLQKAGITKDGQAHGEAGGGGVSQHKLALAAFERKAEKEKGTQHAQALSALRGGGVTVSADEESKHGSTQFAEARARLLMEQKSRTDVLKSSQREEAMRRLNAAGVVPTKQAYSCKQSSDSQRTAAMQAFQEKGGVDVSAGAISRNKLKPVSTYKAPAPQSGATQRQAAMQALQANLRG